MDILEYKHSVPTYNLNYKLIPVTVFDITDEGMRQFNEVIDYAKSIPGIGILNRTNSGGIALGNKLVFPGYDIRRTNTVAELTLITIEGCWRFQFRSKLDQEANPGGLSGAQAFQKFYNMCERYGIYLDYYAVENGEEIKQTIEAPPIGLANDFVKDATWKNVHHVDFHSSYPAGLANTHPEFRDLIEFLYLRRRTSPECKAILNYSIGFMQSIAGCNARYATLSRDAIHDNNNRVRELATRIEKNGGFILAYNTDGIWFKGEKYHGYGEGHLLGQWSYDHEDCIWRAKSSGCYEFIEDGKYNVVARGRTKLDTIKPRSEWQWGDIYDIDAEPVTYSLTEGGIKRNG